MFQVLQYFVRYAVRNPPVFLRLLILIVAVLFYGTSGFLYYELPTNPELTWGDGLWYTVVTMTTVGYGDFFPKTAGGRFLVGWPVMIFGIGLLGYALSVIAAALVTSKTKETKGMASFTLRNHLVVFNYPGIAKLERLLDELSLDPIFGKRMQTVLVDEDLEELPTELARRNVHYVRGNPVRNETLLRASVEFADHALVLSKTDDNGASDNRNIAIALAIEGCNQKVNTVVEIADPGSEELLRKTGCDKIVCSSRLDAHFLSQELVNPGVQEVVEDLLSAKKGQNIYLTEAVRSLSFGEAVDLCHRNGHLVLGIRKESEVILNPGESQVVEAGDRIITVGPARIDSLY